MCIIQVSALQWLWIALFNNVSSPESFVFILVYLFFEYNNMQTYIHTAREKESGSHESLFWKNKKYSEECKMMLIKITTTDMKEKENEDKLGSELKIFAFFNSLYPLFFIPPHVHAILFYSSIAMTTIREQKKEEFLNHHHHHTSSSSLLCMQKCKHMSELKIHIKNTPKGNNKVKQWWAQKE